MNRRSFSKWVLALPIAAKWSRKDAGAATMVPKPVAWLCLQCGVGSVADTPEKARTALAVHYSSAEHSDRLEVSEHARVLKGQIKRARAWGVRPQSGYSAWVDAHGQFERERI